MGMKKISSGQTSGLHSLQKCLKKKPRQKLDVKFRTGFLIESCASITFGNGFD